MAPRDSARPQPVKTAPEWNTGAKRSADRKNLNAAISEITKTKPSHYKQAATPQEAAAPEKPESMENVSVELGSPANPPGFDYAFNLDYGARHTTGDPLIERIRAILDAETAARAAKSTRAER